MKPFGVTTRTWSFVVAGAAVAALLGCGSSGSSTTPSTTSAGGSGAGAPGSGRASSPGPTPSSLAPTHGTYSPTIRPADFSTHITNPYFPLPRGTKIPLVGTAENGKTPQTDVSIVTNRTQTILGVPSLGVRDTVYQRGKPIEHTIDYYAQDKQGNVWYMGEDALDLKHGHFVNAPDSWRGGVKGAEPGIIMPAHPSPSGGSYRQEYYPGHAMDQAVVKGPGGTVKTPAKTFHDTLTTVESSVLERGISEQKWYVRGVGEIKEMVVKGNQEHFALSSLPH